jgi:hypothetical protein
MATLASRILRVAVAAAALASCLALSAPALSQSAAAPAPTAGQSKVVGLGFVGRMVADLDRSVAFYKALGFSQDPAANSDWRKDEVVEHLYDVKDVQTRMAKMYVNSNV